jgi:hypothetical protein
MLPGGTEPGGAPFVFKLRLSALPSSLRTPTKPRTVWAGMKGRLDDLPMRMKHLSSPGIGA